MCSVEEYYEVAELHFDPNGVDHTMDIEVSRELVARYVAAMSEFMAVQKEIAKCFRESLPGWDFEGDEGPSEDSLEELRIALADSNEQPGEAANPQRAANPVQRETTQTPSDSVPKILGISVSEQVKIIDKF